MEQKTQVRKQLSKAEQDKIVPKTITGGLPLNVGYSIGVKVKQNPIPKQNKKYD